MNNLNIDLLKILYLSIYLIPNLTNVILPFIIIFGLILAFIKLDRDKEIIAVGESHNPEIQWWLGPGNAIVWKRSAFPGGTWVADTSSIPSSAIRLISVTAGGSNNNTVITCGTHGALFRYYSILIGSTITIFLLYTA